jgi:hypothetical protein
MARQAFDTGSFDIPNFPIDLTDLNPYGVNYKFDGTNFSFDLMAQGLPTYDLILAPGIHAAYTHQNIPNNSKMIINGNSYRIGVTLNRTIGNRSAFGVLYDISGLRLNDLNQPIQPMEDIFGGAVMKIQPIRENLTELIKEVFIQMVVYDSTKWNNHYDCSYTPFVRYIMKLRIGDRTYFAYIQDLIKGTTLKSLLLRRIASTHYNNYVIQIARKLQKLSYFYKFNHCDFHADNIMLTENPDLANPNDIKSICLIDFGHSRMDIGPLQIYSGVTDATSSKEGRDLTHLFAFLTMMNIVPPGLFTEINNRIFQGPLYNTLIDISVQRKGREYPFPHWGAIYYFNNNDNPNAYPKDILNTYNQGGIYTDTHGNCSPPLEDTPYKFRIEQYRKTETEKAALIARGRQAIETAQAEKDALIAQGRQAIEAVQAEKTALAGQVAQVTQAAQAALATQTALAARYRGERDQARAQIQAAQARLPAQRMGGGDQSRNLKISIPSIGQLDVSKGQTYGCLGLAVVSKLKVKVQKGGKKKRSSIKTRKAHKRAYKKTRKSGGKLTLYKNTTSNIENMKKLIPSNKLKSAPFTSKPSTSKKLKMVVRKKTTYNDISKWSTEALQNTSILDIFNYIRFHLFSEVPKEIMTALFMKLANVPHKMYKIDSEFLEALQTKNIEALAEFAEKYEIKDLDEQLYNQLGKDAFIPDMNTIIDIYMENEDEQLAHALFGSFLDSGCMYEEEWKTYVSNYKKLDKQMRPFFVNKFWSLSV